MIITSGISDANPENNDLIRRILPPGTPVYVGGRCHIGLDEGGGEEEEEEEETGSVDEEGRSVKVVPRVALSPPSPLHR